MIVRRKILTHYAENTICVPVVVGIAEIRVFMFESAHLGGLGSGVMVKVIAIKKWPLNRIL